MSDLGELYQELILDHYRRPRNARPLADATARAQGHNPLCGDTLTLTLRIAGDRIADIGFDANGCAISTAAASLMSEAVKGRTVAEAERLFHRFHGLLTGNPGEGDADVDLGKLEAFAGVGNFPARVKCATLAWHTLDAALHGRGESVSTE